MKKMQEFIVRKFDNDATEIISTNDGGRRVKYNTGDVVFMMYDKVVAYVTHDGKFWESPEFRQVHNSLYKMVSGSFFQMEA